MAQMENPEVKNVASDMAPGSIPGSAPDAADDLRELDCLYRQIDKVYYEFARECGLSSCAYWMMYDLLLSGNEAALCALTNSWAYSKQTVGSALKSLETKGLIELAYAEGSRKNKIARFTAEGCEFAERFVAPAVAAERRAYAALPLSVRRALVGGVRSYVASLQAEFSRVQVEKLDRSMVGMKR